MNTRILFFTNLILVSMLVWPPGGSLLAFQFSTPDMLLRMAIAIWLWVGAMLVGEYHLLRVLRHRRRSRTSTETRDGEWNAFANERRNGDRRATDRRQQDDGPPSVLGERRQSERRNGARRAGDAFGRSAPGEGNWRSAVVSQIG